MNKIMVENIQEYMKNFKEEQKELLVRINWCYKKGKSGEFSSIENYYDVTARFDMALDAKTGEPLQTDLATYKWLEWFVPKKKKLFGFKYGFQFEEGKIYHILAREYINKPTDKFIRYYVDDVLEYDIKDNRFDPVYLFESKFDDEVLDLVVLIKSKICGWSRDNFYRMPSATMIAFLDLKTNEVNRHPTFLRWIEKDTNSKLRYNFEDLGIYHIQARKSNTGENAYMLVDVVNKTRNECLEDLKKEYMKPVIFTYKETKFTLNRRYNQFEGQLNYQGEMCDFYLMVSEEDTGITKHINKLDEIFDNPLAFDIRVREYVAEELYKLANDWLDEDGDEISKEEFMKKIGNPTFNIYSDGTICLMYDTDGMFTDHVITVKINDNGDLVKAEIEG